MTMRDLTKRQLYNMRRRADKQLKEFNKKQMLTPPTDVVWRAAYNKGLLAGLEVPRAN